MTISISPNDSAVRGLDPSEEDGYKTLCPLAIWALLLGLASALSLIHPLMWAVPVVTVMTAIVALRRIVRSEGAETGRGLVLLGLSLAIVFGSAAASRRVLTEWAIRRDARAFAQLWFELLADGEPHKAQQLGNSPEYRQPLDADLWEHYRDDPKDRQSLQDFVDQPLVRALLELSHKAKAKLCETVVERGGRRDTVLRTYRVTYDDADKRKTFYCQIVLERTQVKGTGNYAWRVTRFDGATPRPQ